VFIGGFKINGGEAIHRGTINFTNVATSLPLSSWILHKANYGFNF